MKQTWDAIVIGAGPAGMAAATCLGEGGARTLLIDEQDAPGGQVYRAIERNRENAALMTILGQDYARGAELVARLRQSGARLETGTGVWRVDPDGRVWTLAKGQAQMHAARNVVIATGAMERAVPVPGWTLPGVMTVGALQILLKASGMVAEGPLVLAGSGPLIYLYAYQCLVAGFKDMVLLDTTPARNYLAAALHLPAALPGAGWRLLAKGVTMIAALRRAGIAMHRGVGDLRIEGQRHVEAVSFTAQAIRHRIACRLVGLHEGIVPHQHMSLSLGCRHALDVNGQSVRPQRDRWGKTSLPNVFIIGDAGGIIGARACEQDGEIAALAILARLGRLDRNACNTRRVRAERAKKQHLRIRPLLDRLYAPAPSICTPPDAVIVCRCENIRAADIRLAAARGGIGPNQVKAYLRTGMGPCQGRICGHCTSALIAAETGRDLGAAGYYTIRPPLKPLSAGQLAALTDIDGHNQDIYLHAAQEKKC